jgi:phosphoheptose isomerase
MYGESNKKIDTDDLDGRFVRRGFVGLSRLAAQMADEMEKPIERAGELLIDCFRRGRKVLVSGNGGSAADAQHFVAELVGRMRRERQPLPAISLSSDPSVVTALANDYGYESLFARQIEGLGQTGDILLAISTSGCSPNVLKAVAVARQRRLRVIVLLGQGGDPSLNECDLCLRIPTNDTQRVQELHMAVLHSVCEYVEKKVTAGAFH